MTDSAATTANDSRANMARQGADRHRLPPLVSERMEGVYICCVWGNLKPQVDMAKIVEVHRPRTVDARLVKTRCTAAFGRNRPVIPTGELYGDRFWLTTKRTSKGRAFLGSYPFRSGDRDDGTRRGLFYAFERPDSRRNSETDRRFRRWKDALASILCGDW